MNTTPIYDQPLKVTNGVLRMILKTIFPKLQARTFTATSANSKNLIYVGPVNQMVKRMKTFSIGSALTSTAFAPALIYFSADHWSLFAKFGLVSSGIKSV